MRAHCPTCEREGRPSLHEGTPAVYRKDPNDPSSRDVWRVRITVHPDGKGGICAGSGVLV